MWCQFGAAGSAISATSGTLCSRRLGAWTLKGRLSSSLICKQQSTRMMSAPQDVQICVVHLALGICVAMAFYRRSDPADRCREMPLVRFPRTAASSRVSRYLHVHILVVSILCPLTGELLTFLFGSLEAVYSPPLCPAPYRGHAVVPRGVSWVPPKKKKTFP